MSKYETLSKQLTEQIARNLQQGITALPTEAQLAGQYRVSRQTVRAALALLREKGLIESRQGSGSYATGLSPDTSGNLIPILIASSQEYIYPQLLADIRSALGERGYQLQIYPTDNDASKERQILLSLLETPPRGLIVEGSKSALPTPNTDLYEKLKAEAAIPRTPPVMAMPMGTAKERIIREKKSCTQQIATAPIVPKRNQLAASFGKELLRPESLPQI